MRAARLWMPRPPVASARGRAQWPVSSRVITPLPCEPSGADVNRVQFGAQGLGAIGCGSAGSRLNCTRPIEYGQYLVVFDRISAVTRPYINILSEVLTWRGARMASCLPGT